MGVSDLVAALAGGAIGSALTMLARVGNAPAEVDHHDRRIRDIDADLERFVADEHTRLVFEAVELRGATAAGLKTPLDTAFAVDRAIHKYRDEETRCVREVRDIYAIEGAAHWIWRRVRDRPGVTLATPDRAHALVDRWPRMVPITEPEGVRLKLTDPRDRSIDAILAHATLGDGEEGDIWNAL
jgi:hypothetical protein